MSFLADILSLQVSAQRTAFTRHSTRRAIGDVLHDIRSDRLRDQVQSLRGLLAAGNDKAYKARKILLEGVTFAGAFRDVREGAGLEIYHGICVFDIDHLSPPEIERLLASFSGDDYVIACWLSPSAAGIKGLVKFGFSRPLEMPEVKSVHKKAYRDLAAHFEADHGVALDTSGSDVTRLCFLSWDPNLHLKDCFEEFPIDDLETSLDPAAPAEDAVVRKGRTKRVAREFDPSPYLDGRGKNRPRDRYFVQRSIRYLRKRKLSITSSYDRWYKVAFGIADAFTYDLGSRYFLELCRLDGANHDEERSLDLIRYCYEHAKRSISIATVMFYVKYEKESRGELFRRGGIHDTP